MEESSDDSDESWESLEHSAAGLQLDAGSGRCRRSHEVRCFSPRYFFALGVGLVLIVMCAAWRVASVRKRATPTSVRAFIESPELADAGAVSFAESFGHQELVLGTVRAGIAGSFANFSRQLRDAYPEEYAQLTAAELTPDQQASTLSLLRHYGDARMLRVAHDTAAAAQETVVASGDRISMKRRLVQKLLPQVGDLQRLCNEIYGGQVQCRKFALSEADLEGLEPLQNFDRWHMQLKVKGGPRATATAATMVPMRELHEVARGQVMTVFRHMHSMLGDKVPLVPLRHLNDLGVSTEQQGHLEQPTSPQRLLTCLEEGFKEVLFPNLIQGVHAFMDCFAAIMPHLWSWLSKKFLELTGEPSPARFSASSSDSHNNNSVSSFFS